MDKHTPGPWRFSPWHVEEDASAVRAPEGWLICQPASDADARLIAAAPDLLEALKHVMGWIDGWNPNFTNDPDWPEHAHHIRAAIAKAQGGAA